MSDRVVKCSMCGKELRRGQPYLKCTVSTCNSGRIRLAFCSPGCWDAHLPTARHRTAAYTEHVVG